jgi:hypothetical protein
MNKFTLFELYGLRERMVMQNDYSMIDEINKTIKNKEEQVLENTSATGGLSVGGMGAVVSAQPSGLAGQTIGPNWASGGGTTGSGDVSVPYNPSGTNRVFQKLESPMGKNHGSRTGKKSRTKKLDLKSLRTMMSKPKDFEPSKSERGKKVMNYNDFLKNDFTTIKK